LETGIRDLKSRFLLKILPVSVEIFIKTRGLTLQKSTNSRTFAEKLAEDLMTQRIIDKKIYL
jgi:hypothetical protein